MADGNIPTGRWAPGVPNAVVTIHVAAPYPFDTGSSRVSEGTGFVVDKTNGYILTNRHLVGEGPITVRAVFKSGYTQAIVQPVYVDPCHDFALVKYNVGSLTSEVEEIPLRPDLAKVNLDIRIAGNDAGAVMSVLQGVISRVNCNPPEYGGGYQDSMTNYLQGSADTTGGSSGSPVVDVDGHAVGMVAGGMWLASTDYYLALDLPLRVLKSLQSGQHMSRGTIQSTWTLRDPATCDTRGISREIIDNSGSIGLFVADQIVPHGPSDGQIQEGDVLLDIEGEKMGSLVQFEHLLDTRVGDKITIRRLRHGEESQVEVLVQDLFGITPFRLLQFAGAVFHDLRLQIALKWNFPINGVYLPAGKGSFDRIEGVIRSVDGQPTSNLEAFMDVIRKISFGQKFAVGYQRVFASQISYKIVTMSPLWQDTKTKLWTRDNYVWIDSDLGVPQIPRAPSSEAMRPDKSDESFDAQEKNTASLVRVKTYNQLGTNHALEGEHEFSGLVISVSKGFVLISKAHCLSFLCTVAVIVDEKEFPAEIVYDHPLGNFLVIQFDSSHIERKLRSVTFGQGVLKENDRTTVYGRWQRKVEATVRSIEPMSESKDIIQPPINAEVIRLNAFNPPDFGVLLDANGDALALWLPVWHDWEMQSVGVSAHLIMPVIESLQQGSLPAECRTLAATFKKIDKLAARMFGVPLETIPQFEDRGLIQVRRVAITSETGLLAGDVVLYVDGKPVKRLWDLAPAISKESLLVTVVRDTKQVTLNLPTFPTSNWHCKSSAWCLGARIESPLFSTALTARSLYSQLLVTQIAPGSPADEYEVPSNHFITHINGKPTKDIENFVQEVETLGEHTWCPLTLIGPDGVSTSKSVLSNRFFKSKLSQRNDSMPYQWKRREI